MAGPCVGVLGWAVGWQVQRRPAFRHWSDDPMTELELLTAILEVLQSMEKMQTFTMIKVVGDPEAPPVESTPELEQSPGSESE